MTSHKPFHVPLGVFASLLTLLLLAGGCGGPAANPGAANDGGKDQQAAADKAAEKGDGVAPRDRNNPGKVEKKDGPGQAEKKDALGKPKQEKPKPPPEMKTVHHWTFDNVPDNKLPPGWKQEMGAIRVKDKMGRRALELIGDSGGTAVEPPPVALGDPFFLELEIEYPHKDGSVNFQLLGPNKRFLYVVYDGDSLVNLPGDLPKTHPDHWKVGAINRLRLERRGDQFAVKLNGAQVAAGNLPHLRGDFDRIVLGIFRKGTIPSPRVHALILGQ